MEKIPRGKHYSYPISSFLKEDFVDLIKIFSENCETFEVVIDEYKLNSTNDIEDIPYKQTSDFEITGRNPYITLQGHFAFTQLYLSDIDSVIQQGIKSKIDESFKKNKSVWSYFDNTVGAIALFASLIGSISLVKFNIMGILVPIFLAILVAIVIYMSIKKHIVIYLKRSVNSQSFWEKNGDYIIVTIITTVIAGLLIGLVLKVI